MSTYTDASLIMFPSGYKEDKIYSLKPTDGSGDLTFTRASTATRVNAEGLIETSPVNLVQQSNTFNVTWASAGSGATTVIGQTDPDGGSNAWLLTKLGQTGRIEQTLNVGGVQTFFIYAKKNTSDFIQITIFDGIAAHECWFNLSTGVVGTQNSATGAIESVGGGWYKCSITSTNNIASGVIQIYQSEANGVVSGTTGAISIFNSQLNIGATAKPYFPTTDRLNVPRIDYTGGGCGKLLLEPQRTNLLTLSNYIDGWGKTNVSVTSNDITSPDGYQNASKLERNATGGYVSLNTSASGSQAYSVFLKKGNLNFGRILAIGTGNPNVYFDLENGSVGTASNATGSIVDYGNGWYRCTMVYSETITAVRIYPVETDNSTGGALGYVYAYEAQCESGTYATSIIPTLGTAVTRVADSASKSGISSLIGQTQGTLFVDIDVINLNPSNVSRIILSDGTTNNYIFLGINEAGSGNLSRLFINNFGTSFSLSLFSSTAITIGLHKLALAYKSGEFALYLDGNSVASSSATGTIPATSQIVIGGTSPSTISNLETLVLNKSILFPTRLTNTELQSLTSL